MQTLLLAVLGLLFGSFLNVIIYRLPLILKRQLIKDYESLTYGTIEQPVFSLAWPPSHCINCQHRLRWWHNLPIISYLFLKGRCAFCHAPISARYPVVEFLGSLSSILMGHCFGDDLWILSFSLVFCWILIALTFIDWKEQLLPDQLTLSLLWLGLILNLKNVFTPLAEGVIGVVVGYLFLWLVAKLYRLFRKIEGIGYGDLKLFAALGSWFGWKSLPQILLISSLLALLVIAILILIGKFKVSEPFAFGPFLALSGFISLMLQNYPTYQLSNLISLWLFH